jgi:hypothetical protein
LSSEGRLRAERIVSLLWLPIAFALSLPAYRWHQEYFHNAGPLYTLVRCLPMLGVAALAYGFWLRPFFERFEFTALIVVPVIVGAAVHPLAMCVVAVVAISALALGDLITAPMRFEHRDTPVVWAAGFGALILLLALFGKLGLISAPWLTGLLIPLFLRAIFVWKRLFSWLSPQLNGWTASGAARSPIARICLFFLFLFEGCSLLLILSPVTAFDVVAYHFPLARFYSESHFIQPTREILQSYFPQGAEALMALGFSLGGAPAAQLLMAFLGVLFLWLVMRAGRCCGFSPVSSLAGAAITATFPFLHWTLSVPKDDAALALFQLAALYCFLQWRKGRGYRWILLGSFLLGQTAGIKHIALFGLVAIAPLWLWAWKQERVRWRGIALAVCLFAAAGLFWHVRTYLLTGNPVFPEGTARAAHTPNQDHVASRSGPLRRYATLPWYLQFHGEKAFESASANPLGILLFLFAPALLATFWARKWTPPRKACLVFGLVYLAYWSSVSSTLRYAIVPFALIALAAGAAVVRLSLSEFRLARSMAGLGLAYSLLFSLLVVMTFEVNSLQVAYLLNRISAHEYLRQAIPTTGPLFRLAAQHPKASVFGVANCSRFYAPDPLRFGCALCSEGCSTKEVMAPLESRQFEFVILPVTPDFNEFKALIATRFNAAETDRDGRFVTLMLNPR